jgi:fucose permease
MEPMPKKPSTMNLVEGFFGIGSILGPAIVALLLTAGLSWKWLYVIAAALCAVLILLAWTASYPISQSAKQQTAGLARTIEVARSPYALFFSVLVMLYVAVEVSVYVWMPTYLETSQGSAKIPAPYALTAFFVLRAVGRLTGAWTLKRFSWSAVLAIFGFALFACFGGALLGGRDVGAVLLPLSGLFMSVMYPTLNSKGISCFDRSEHGCVAGVILFFTAVAAAAGPLAMAVVSDAYGDARYGFVLAAGFALVLFLGLLINLLTNPAGRRLRELDRADYAQQPG